jgi:hypothetical protein
MSKARPITIASVKSIMNGRVTVPTTAVGKRVKLLIQGDGNVVDVFDKQGNPVASVVEPDTQLQKRIFNARANSEMAMKNPRNIGYLKNGIAAEKAGGTVKGIIGSETKPVEHTADEYLSAYLNATQLSFGVLLPSATADKIQSGVEIAATVQRIEGENGSLLTIDPSTISVQAPETLSSTSFNIDDFMDEEEEVEEVKAPAKPASAKKALRS